MSKRASLRQSLKNLEAQIKTLQSQYEEEKVQLARVEQVIQDTSEELVDGAPGR
jgi:chaperonin cofactor prefoldin